MSRKPFDMLRAVFFLLAIIILAQVGTAMFAGAACVWFNFTISQQVGACLPISQLIREQWDKMFEAILALLVAAASSGRSPPPPPTDQH